MTDTPRVLPSRDQAAAGGRRSGESRRRQTAREIAAAATTQAISDLFANPPELTDEQRDRLRTIILGGDR